MTNQAAGGYDVEFVHDDIYCNSTCAICLLVLREPMQAADCGHRFCKSCLVGLKKRYCNYFSLDSSFITAYFQSC